MRVTIGDIYNFATTTKLGLASRLEKLNTLQIQVRNFADDNTLKGYFYNKFRNYYINTYIPLVEEVIKHYENLVPLAIQIERDLMASLGKYTGLDTENRATLRSKISSLKLSIRSLESRKVPNYGLIHSYYTKMAEMEKELEQINIMERTNNELVSKVNDVSSAVKSLTNRMSDLKSWPFNKLDFSNSSSLLDTATFMNQFGNDGEKPILLSDNTKLDDYFANSENWKNMTGEKYWAEIDYYVSATTGIDIANIKSKNLTNEEKAKVFAAYADASVVVSRKYGFIQPYARDGEWAEIGERTDCSGFTAYVAGTLAGIDYFKDENNNTSTSGLESAFKNKEGVIPYPLPDGYEGVIPEGSLILRRNPVTGKGHVGTIQKVVYDEYMADEADRYVPQTLYVVESYGESKGVIKEQYSANAESGQKGSWNINSDHKGWIIPPSVYMADSSEQG